MAREVNLQLIGIGSLIIALIQSMKLHNEWIAENCISYRQQYWKQPLKILDCIVESFIQSEETWD